MKVNVINLKGEKVKDLTLNDLIWKIEPNDDCLKKSLKLQMDASRQGTRKTKTRSEVSGGGRKPYRQKGTGRARHGSIRSNIWKGGGIAFGVSPNNFAFKINKKERRLALKSALTYTVLDKKLKVVDKMDIKSHRVKDFNKILADLKLEGKTLFITKEDISNLSLATRNLSNIGYILASEINCYDLTNANNIVMDEEVVKYIEEVLV